MRARHFAGFVAVGSNAALCRAMDTRCRVARMLITWFGGCVAQSFRSPESLRPLRSLGHDDPDDADHGSTRCHGADADGHGARYHLCMRGPWQRRDLLIQILDPGISHTPSSTIFQCSTLLWVPAYTWLVQWLAQASPCPATYTANIGWQPPILQLSIASS